MTRTCLSVLAAATLFTTTRPAEAAIYGYYVGTDNLTTFTSGTYNGLANPNHRRLTFLLAHAYPVNPPPGELDSSVNHFHTLGSYRYSGPAGSPSIIFGNARVPEGTRPPIPLVDGSGAFAGKLVSAPSSDPVLKDYTNFSVAPLGQLRAFHENGIPNEPEDYMYFGQVHPTNPALSTAASNQRYSTTNLTGSDVWLELVSITSGMTFGNAAGNPLAVNPGDQFRLGDGDAFAVFEPYFWTDNTAAQGSYEAKFKLVDRNNLFGSSGEFRWEFAVVPEPSSAVLGIMASAVLLRRRRN